MPSQSDYRQHSDPNIEISQLEKAGRQSSVTSRRTRFVFGKKNFAARTRCVSSHLARINDKTESKRICIWTRTLG
jgi:hypothetical protein